MTLLIKNVRVLCAEREFSCPADVFVIGDKISAVGNFPNKKADEVIDGQGIYLVPGFIDVHGESDHHWSLLTHPAQDDLLRQGITTVLWGHNGVSIAPFIGRNFALFETWTSPRRVAVGWTTLKEALAHLKAKSMGVNFASLVGQTMVTEAVAPGQKDLAERERRTLKSILEPSLKDGAWGISLDPFSIHRPYITKNEFMLAVELARANKSVLAMGSLAGVPEEVIGEISVWLEDARDVKILFTNVEQLTTKALDALFKATDKMPNVHFETSPFEGDVRPLYSYIPSSLWKSDLPETQFALKNAGYAKEVLAALPKLKPAEIWVVKSERSPSLAGASLKKLMNDWGMRKTGEAVLKLMREAGLHALVLENRFSKSALKKILAHPRVLIGSRGASVPEHERRHMAELMHDVAAFPAFIKFATEHKLASFEDAVRKITRAPAQFLDIKHRGELREGWLADLVGISKDGDVVFTVVNGKVAWKDGKKTDSRNGKALEKKLHG